MAAPGGAAPSPAPAPAPAVPRPAAGGWQQQAPPDPVAEELLQKFNRVVTMLETPAVQVGLWPLVESCRRCAVLKASAVQADAAKKAKLTEMAMLIQTKTVRCSPKRG